MRISSVCAWKSGAWRCTISATVCAKPSSRRPITFSGKTQGKVSSASRFSSTSGGDGALRPERGLVLLEERVHAAEDRAGLAVAHGLAVERGHREHFLGGGREPHLVGGAQLRLGDGAHLELHL